MIVINTISEKYFSLNGIQFAKIYQPLAQGTTGIGLYSIFDSGQQLQNSTPYNEFLINGSTYTTQAATVAAILAVTYTALSPSEIDTIKDEINDMQNNISYLEENQYSGVLTYKNYADRSDGSSFLPTTGTLLVSYKVANDAVDPTKNGYYYWDGSQYQPQAKLVQTIIDAANTYEGVTGRAVYDFVSELSLISKPENVTFYQDESGNWKLDLVASAINAKNGTYSTSSVVNDILLSQVGYSYLIINMQTGAVFAETVEATAFAYIKAKQNFGFIGRVFPTYNLFDMRCQFNVNGYENNLNRFTDLEVDTPILTDTIAFTDDKEIPFYKDSLFKKLTSGKKYNVVLETGDTETTFKRIEINNPTLIKASDITGDNTNTRIVFESNFEDRQLVFKNITNIIKSVTSGKSGTYNLLTIGDSITQGNASYQVSPLYLIKQRLAAYGVTINGVGTFAIDNPSNTPPGLTGSYYAEGRGYWTYKNFVGRENSPYGNPIMVNLTDAQTAKFENPFVRVATATDKTNNPEWCFTNANMNPADDDGVSYSEDPSQPSGIYYIFDFANYLSAHSVTTPDIISIALGTNDWQETGVINVDDEFLSMQIMYEQIRAALPTVPILFVPSQSLFPEDQPEWENEMFPLLERIISFLEDQADSNLHIAPIFQNMSRFRAYSALGTPARINTYNSVKKATANNVHILDVAQPRKEYMDIFEAAILNII